VTAPNESKKRWKIIDLINWTTEYLGEKGFENSRLNVERLLAHVLNIDRVRLYLNFDRPLTSNELAEFKELLKRRLEHEPLQYIIGQTEFMSLPFNVNCSVLIPRPETEILVEKAIQYCNDNFSHQDEINILDVGTGSGNIAISLAKKIESAQVVAIDISEDAIQVAQQNAALNQVEDKISFHCFDALQLENYPSDFTSFFHVIVSNPPYVKAKEYQNLAPEITDYEPQAALVAGEDGLDFYINFSKIVNKLLREDGRVFFEIGEDMAEPVVKILQDVGLLELAVFQDLAERDRIVTGIKSKK